MASEFFVTNGITLVSMFFVEIVLAIYFTKAKTKTASGKSFLSMVITTLVVMISSIVWGVLATKESGLTELFGRITNFLTVSWNFTLMLYITVVFRGDMTNEQIKKQNKIWTIIGIIGYSISLICTIFLELNTVYYPANRIYVMEGPLYLFVNIMGGIAILYAVIKISTKAKMLDKLTIILALFTIVLCSSSMALGLTGLIKMNDVSFMHAMVVMFLYLSMESQDKALIAEFNESNEQARKSNQLKSEFIMNMSHQLRTPMNTILGFSDSLLATEDLSQSDLIMDSQSIEQASKKLLDLINSILEISKLESKKEIINNIDYTLDSIIFDVSSHINSRINKENLVFTINANSNCPNDLYGDPEKIARVLNILLQNAVKSTDYGEVSFNVSSSVVDLEYHEFTFHIKNTGHTMQQEDFNRSFEDLIKLSADGNNDIDADTLKIIAAKGLLSILGGTVEFINQAGQGTQYIVKIKQKVTTQNELGNIREKIQTRQEAANIKVDLTGKKVLIIDDKNINTIILQRLLRQYNPEVENTLNPRDGIEKITNTTYDLVFVNHEMEEMSGEEVIKKLETTGNKLPKMIGLVSGTTEISDKRNYTAILDCPIDFRQLNKVIKQLFKEEL